jgi:hypothetical protein
MTRRAVSATGLVVAMAGCTSIDPGPDFVVPNATFDPDYFYCHVEPQFLFAPAYQCGSGQPSDNGQCHFNTSAVTGMALIAHPPIDCGGGDHPVNLSQITSIPQGDLAAVSLEMSTEYTTAPIFVRPTGNSHPRAIFQPNDKTANLILSTWATK